MCIYSESKYCHLVIFKHLFVLSLCTGQLNVNLLIRNIQSNVSQNSILSVCCKHVDFSFFLVCNLEKMYLMYVPFIRSVFYESLYFQSIMFSLYPGIYTAQYMSVRHIKVASIKNNNC